MIQIIIETTTPQEDCLELQHQVIDLLQKNASNETQHAHGYYLVYELLHSLIPCATLKNKKNSNSELMTANKGE